MLIFIDAYRTCDFPWEGSAWIHACNEHFCGLYLSIIRFKFVISFVRSFGGTWYMYILASICDFCTYRIKCCFELSPTLTLPTCEQRRLCRDFVCAQVRKIYMKTELQCVLSRPCRDETYIIFSPPRFPKTGWSITVKGL